MTRPIVPTAGAAALAIGLTLAAAARGAPIDAPPPPGPAPEAKAAPPANGLVRWFDPDTAPFLPIPEIDVSPSSGLTVGLIPVVLSNNDAGQIDRILAPDVIHSQYFGWGARWRIFRYPSEDERWSIVGGAKQRTEGEFDSELVGGLQRRTPVSWRLHAMYDRSGSDRFFGLGNDSDRNAQSTYVDTQSLVEGSISRNFGREAQVTYDVRGTLVDIGPGVLPQLPSATARFPTLPGIGLARALQQRVIVSLDSRDSVTAPTRGRRIAAYAGIAGPGAVRYTFAGFDATQFYSPPGHPDIVLAAHAAARYMPDYGKAPFWAYSSLGGDRDILGEAQALRAVPAGRYVDRNSFALGFEARITAMRFHLFATDLTLEPAPFVDLGKVYSRMSSSPVSKPKAAAGLGLRMVARPFIVGYLDIGVGREGLAIFTGIDYPF